MWQENMDSGKVDAEYEEKLAEKGNLMQQSM